MGNSFSLLLLTNVTSDAAVDEWFLGFPALKDLDEEYASTTIFKTRIAHGMLTASFISAVLGARMPGPGAIYLAQNLRFKAPVRPGDTVTAVCEIKSIDLEKRRVTLSTQCLVKGKIVVDGEATVMPPSRSQKD
ncbi:MAG: MaoC family dehydratase [Rhodospirillales bacterium]